MNDEFEAPADVSCERVYTTWDYYDGPREGIADFRGKPHIYKCQFSEPDDDWTDLFWLMEIDQELFKLAEEKWTIFLRWKREFELGNASLDSHPALPEDRARFDELGITLGDRLKLRPERSVIRRARFVRAVEADGTYVEWTKL